MEKEVKKLRLDIDGNQVDRPAVWWDEENKILCMIDQTKIPFDVKVHICDTFLDTAQAIKNMIIRGAPSIGAAAAFGLAQAVSEFWNNENFNHNIRSAYEILLSTRPTAVDLKHGLEYIIKTVPLTPENALNQAKRFSKDIAEEGKKIGEIGQNLIKSDMNLLTHCHTGALALVDNGSALAPIIQAWIVNKKRFHVYVDETRPRIQGRITSWELDQYGIDHTVICDSVSGSLMSQRKVDLIIVGADRVAQNGDIANKIGTYNLAVIAHYHNIPFYTAFPRSTFDPTIKTGEDILIEERNQLEVKEIKGYSREYQRQLSISPYSDKTKFFNPSFDVTPHSLIKGYITPEGILEAFELAKKLE
jgi:S-methyl-5-thioribose-1-phosphate isomerase